MWETSKIDCWNGTPPTPAEIAASPIVERWHLREAEGDSSVIDVWGVVYGHPHIEDGHHAITSEIVQIDPSSPPTWARSTNRVYRLGKPAGEAQMAIHKLAESKGVAPWRRASSFRI